MRRLTMLLTVAALGLAAGCDDSRDGYECNGNEDCDEGSVCLSQIYNCFGEECLGTCERECTSPAECEGGEVCTWVRTVRVCRSSDYQDP